MTAPGTAERTCKTCSRTFEIPLSQARKGRGIYCGIRCMPPGLARRFAGMRDGAAAMRAAVERAAQMRADLRTGLGPVPVVRVPSVRTRVRFTGNCPHCGGTLFDIEWPDAGIARAHPSERGSVVCGMCARTVAILVVRGAT